MTHRRSLVPLVLVALTAASALPDAHARTWTDVEGRKMEADLVRVDGEMVELKRTSGKIVMVAIARLSKADQAFLKATAKPEPGGGDDAGPFQELEPPVTLKVTPIAGEGKSRKAEIIVDNASGNDITELGVRMYFLGKGGGGDKSVPHTHSGNIGKGDSHTIKVSSFFMEDDTAAIDGVVDSLTFKDGSTWPAVPTPPPAQNGKHPVGAKVIGVIGSGDQAEPAVACFNHHSKPVTAVNYRIKYLDADGKVVDTTSYGYSSDTTIMENGKGIVISGGQAPPKGTVKANVTVTNVTFAD